jgi:putative ABC transport system permease protein
MKSLRRLLGFLRRRRLEAEMQAEMQHHLELLAERHRAAGLDATAARQAALREFGNLARVQEEARDIRHFRWVEDAAQDLRLGCRLLVKEPLFSLLGLATIAGGIAATTTLFSVLNTVVLRPLPLPAPDEVVQVWETNAGRGVTQFSVSFLNFSDWRRRSGSFVQLAAAEFPSTNALLGNEPERLRTVAHTQDWFPLFGLRVALGRGPEEEAFKEGAGRVVVISDRLWRTRLAADPGIIGRALALNGASHTVIGVAAPELGVLEGIDLFVPLREGGRNADRGSHDVDVYGRLRPGLDRAAAEAELMAIAAQLAQEYPDKNAGWSVRLDPLRDTLVPPDVRRGLWFLLAAVGVLLVIACTNLAGLLLARAAARTREFAVRAALGGGRGRLIRQMIAETMVMVSLGGLLGGLAATGMIGLLRGLESVGLPRAAEISLDGRVLAFAVFATLVTGMAAALAPAFAASQVQLQPGLKDGAGTGGRRQRARHALMAGQLGLAVVLLGTAALLLRSFLQLQRAELGFRADQVLTARLAPGDQGRALVEQLLERLKAVPGIEAAAVTNSVPMAPQNTSNHVFPVGAAAIPVGQSVQCEWRVVSEDYFRAMQIPLLRGRTFTPADNESAPRVAIINQTLARMLWGDEDPIGRQINPGGGRSYSTVIGVVGDVRSRNPAQAPGPQFYLSAHRWVWNTMTVVIRSNQPADAVAPLLRAELRALDPALPLFEVRTLEQGIGLALAPRRVSALLLGAFAGLAVLLTAIGLFALVAQTVAQRTREVGIRIALGATPRAVVLPLLRDTLRLTGIGVGFGVVVAAAAAWRLRRSLPDVLPFDPLALGAAALALFLVAAFAGYVPVRRAVRVDPVVALRAE